MLDASNPEGPKAKKSKIQSRPAQRFWPDTLVPSQFNTIPIAPAPVTVQAAMVQGAVQIQAVPPGVALPTAITIPNVQGTTVIPGTVTLQQPAGTPTTMVVVTLPPSASHVTTVSASESSSAVTTHPTMIAPTVSSQVETVSVSACLPCIPIFSKAVHLFRILHCRLWFKMVGKVILLVLHTTCLSVQVLAWLVFKIIWLELTPFHLTLLQFPEV